MLNLFTVAYDKFEELQELAKKVGDLFYSILKYFIKISRKFKGKTGKKGASVWPLG